METEEVLITLPRNKTKIKLALVDESAIISEGNNDEEIESEVKEEES